LADGNGYTGVWERPAIKMQRNKITEEFFMIIRIIVRFMKLWINSDNTN
jgi:hypothetical protein